jgi:hypothetical protein
MGSSTVDTARIIEIIEERLFLFCDLHDLSINRLLRISARNSFDKRVLGHLDED